MYFASSTGYALRALAAMPEDGTFSSVRGLAADLGLPPAFLAKVFQSLSQQGLLDATRGPSGGFRLARPAHRVTVGEVVLAVEGAGSPSKCLLGFATCTRKDNPCPMHATMVSLQGHIDRLILQQTIRDLRIAGLRQERQVALLQRRGARKAGLTNELAG